MNKIRTMFSFKRNKYYGVREKWNSRYITKVIKYKFVYWPVNGKRSENHLQKRGKLQAKQ